MTQIRPFCNSDLPILLELWLEHWSALGPAPDVNRARFEQAILSRTFFDPANMLLAEQDGTVQAWCHYAPTRSDDKTAVICGLCIAPTADASVPEQLLETVLKQITDQQFEVVLAGLVRDQDQGYTGLAPVGHGIGVPIVDHRVTALLQQSGFLPEKSIARMVVSALSYRPPVSREALQLRRTSRISSDPEVVISSDVMRASSQSHLDIEHYRLVDRGGQTLTALNLWFSDPEAEVMSPSRVILDVSKDQEQGVLEPAEGYLIAALIQALAERNINTVETAIDSDQSDLIAQLEKLQFYREDEGVLWKKSLV